MDIFVTNYLRERLDAAGHTDVKIVLADQLPEDFSQKQLVVLQPKDDWVEKTVHVNDWSFITREGPLRILEKWVSLDGVLIATGLGNTVITNIDLDKAIVNDTEHMYIRAGISDHIISMFEDAWHPLDYFANLGKSLNKLKGEFKSTLNHLNAVITDHRTKIAEETKKLKKYKDIAEKLDPEKEIEAEKKLFLEMLEIFSLTGAYEDADGLTLELKTPRIELDDYDLGELSVQIKFPSGEVVIDALKEGNCDYCHPHVSSSGTPCFGGYEEVFHEVASQGRVGTALSLIWMFLKTYNPESAYEHPEVIEHGYYRESDDYDEPDFDECAERALGGQCYICRYRSDCDYSEDKIQECKDVLPQVCHGCSYNFSCTLRVDIDRWRTCAKSAKGGKCVDCVEDECPYADPCIDRCKDNASEEFCKNCAFKPCPIYKDAIEQGG